MKLPTELSRILDGQSYRMDTIGMSDSRVCLFDDMVLKIQPDSRQARCEYSMMNWLKGKVPVPKCLYYGIEEGKCYLLMSKVPGKMSCDEAYMADPRTLVRVLADSMQALWKVEISDCPVFWDLDAKLAEARWRVESGEVDVQDAEPETFGPGGFDSPTSLLRWLEEHRPEEDLVLSHGDFCMPNLFIDGGSLSGFIDLGRAGIADRWQDIALCWRSLKHNFGGLYTGKRYEDFDPDELFNALGVQPDHERLRYYLLLDELF